MAATKFSSHILITRASAHTESMKTKNVWIHIYVNIVISSFHRIPDSFRNTREFAVFAMIYVDAEWKAELHYSWRLVGIIRSELRWDQLKLSFSRG